MGMTYDINKSQFGQEYVQEIEIQCDACKYSQAPYSTNNEIYTDNSSVISSGSTGGTTNLDTGTSDANAYTVWGLASATVYGLTNYGEIISFIYVSPTQISLTGRGLFGSAAHTIPRYTKIICKHLGEVDSSCRGFPYNCSNSDSYNSQSKLSLIFSTSQSAGGSIRFSGLRKINHDACEVDAGESIGSRAKLKFEISDQIHGGAGIVPYPDKRTKNGTMFGKLLACHPYFNSRTVLYREGFRPANTYDAPDFLERAFIIDEANLNNGIFSVTALDPLIHLEDKKAQIPIASPAILSAAIIGTPATFSFLDAPSYYFGAMSATVFVRIDSEIIKCTVSGATQLTVVARGYRSEQKDHDDGVSIQDCVVFASTNGVDAIVFAMENYSSIPASFIDDYSATTAFLPSFTMSEAIISKPMPVIDFVNSIVKLGNLIMYYNEVTQKIVIDYVPELSIEPINISESNDIKSGSVTVDQNINNQYTRFSYLWAPVDVTKDTEENYAVRLLSANAALESSENLGQINEKKAIKNLLMTSSAGDSLIVSSYVDRVLSNNLFPPKIATITIDASRAGSTEGGNFKVGSIVNLTTKENQDKDGNSVGELFQVLKISGDGFYGYKTKLKRYQSTAPSNVDYIISDGIYIDYDLSAHYAPPAGSYVIYIDRGAEIGASSTSSPAFTTGSQAAGVSFTIINRGKILGTGGNGGDSGIWTAYSSEVLPTDGEVGGDAFNATVNCIIDNGSGLIWSGGAGGSGSRQSQFPMSPPDAIYLESSGGGGGQGYYQSFGGKRSSGAYPPSLPAFSGNEDGGNSASAGLTGNAGGSWGESVGMVSAGLSIKTNGKAVNLISGNNNSNLKGAIL